MSPILGPLRWSFVAINSVLIVAGLALMFASLDAEIPDFFGFRGFDAIASAAYTAVAVLVLYGRPANGVGWFVMAVGFIGAISWFVSQYGVATLLGGVSLPGGVYAAWVQSWIWVLLVTSLVGILPALFPHGRLESRFARLVVIGALLAMVSLGVAAATPSGMMSSAAAYAINPFPVEGLPYETLEVIGFLTLIAVAVSGALSLSKTYRGGSETERLQIKWLLAAVLFIALQFVAMAIIFLIFGRQEGLEFLQDLTAVGFFAIPISMGFAITRYRLYEIDVVINRAIVYAPLTAMVAAAYVGAVQLSKLVFVGLTGERSDSEILTATLIAAAVFWIIRVRMIGVVDRHFKDPREPAKDLRSLQERIRSTTRFVEPSAISPERVAEHVVESTVSAFDAEGGRIELTSTRTKHSPMVIGDWQGPPSLALDISHNGATYGQLLMGPRKQAKPYSERDQEPLSETANVLAEILASRIVPRQPQPRRRPL